jgi:hypothetical protein
MHSCSVLLATSVVPMLGATEKVPDMAFFEYLAELVEVNGELVGPLDLAPTDPAEKSNNIEPEQNKDAQINTPKVQQKNISDNKAVKQEDINNA